MFIPILFGLIACGEKDNDTALDNETDTETAAFVFEDQMQEQVVVPILFL